MAAFTEEQMKDFSIKNWYDLSGQVAVVTGANSGVGAAIAKLFAAEGATVVMTARREAALEEVSAQIEEAGGKVELK